MRFVRAHPRALAVLFLWFAGASLVIVWQVFRDPAIDHRLVVAGALLPDAVDGLLGGPRSLHSLAAPVVVLAVVMVATGGRRVVRRRLLALPIGLFLHLVLDAMWARTETFWWPAFGLGFPDDGLPSLSRPAPLLVALEVAGAAALAWFWNRFRLAEPPRRRTFLTTGRLGRDLAGELPHGRRS